MPMSDRTARAARFCAASGSAELIATPFMMTRPPLGSSSKARQRSNVVLPEPDGPITQTTSCSATGRLTPQRTSCAPKCLLIFSAAMIDAAPIRPSLG